MLNNGTISPRKNQFIEFFVDDVYGNSSTLTFRIDNKQKVPTKVLNVGRYDSPVFPFNQRNFFKNDSISLNIPAKSLYDTINFDYKMINDTFSSLYAPIHQIHSAHTPLHHPFKVEFVTTVPSHLSDKAFVCKIENEKVIGFVGGTFDKGTISATIKTFGDYSVAVDTVAPNVKGLNIFSGKKMEGPTLKMTIKDAESGIKSYNAYINKEWVLMEYEPKKNRLTHRFKKNLSNGTHKFTLVVEDNLGNTTEYEATFYK